MKIIDVLRKECVVANAQFNDKAEALIHVVQTARKAALLKDVTDEEILAGLQERESLGSTGFGMNRSGAGVARRAETAAPGSWCLDTYRSMPMASK